MLEEKECSYPLTKKATACSPTTCLLSLIDGFVQPVHVAAAGQVFI